MLLFAALALAADPPPVTCVGGQLCDGKCIPWTEVCKPALAATLAPPPSDLCGPIPAVPTTPPSTDERILTTAAAGVLCSVAGSAARGGCYDPRPEAPWPPAPEPRHGCDAGAPPITTETAPADPPAK